MSQIALDAFRSSGVPVTVLGNTPVPGCAFLEDDPPHGGPARALSRFEPIAEVVIVCSCDLPNFRPEAIQVLKSAIGEREATVPVIDGDQQYLCAAYRASVFPTWRHMVESGTAVSMRELVRVLDVAYIDNTELRTFGANPVWFKGANTPEELRSLLETSDE